MVVYTHKNNLFVMNTITQKIVAGSRFAVVVLAGALFLMPGISFADTAVQYTSSNTAQYQSNSASPTSSGLVVSTQPASQVDQTTAIINGHVSTDAGDNVRVWIEWGPTPALGNVEGVRGGWKEAQTTASLGNLTPGTRYFYRAVGISAGIGDTAYGQVLSFTTPGATKVAQTTTTNSPKQTTTKSNTVLTSTTKTSTQKTTATIGCATSTPISGATIDNNAPLANPSSGLPANAAGSGSGTGVVLLVLMILAVVLGVVAAVMHATASARRAAIAKKDDEQGPGMVIA